MRRHIERAARPQSRYKNHEHECESCGRESIKSDLAYQIRANGQRLLINRRHPGCWNNGEEYQGHPDRNPHYGGA